jgi:hypothetical protein
VRAYSNEVDVKALVAPTIFGQAVAVALKVLEVYAPALFLRIVSCKVVLSTRRSLADFTDVAADLYRQSVDVMGVPRGISSYAPPRFSLKFIAKQHTKSQQHGPDYHLSLLAGPKPLQLKKMKINQPITTARQARETRK